LIKNTLSLSREFTVFPALFFVHEMPLFPAHPEQLRKDGKVVKKFLDNGNKYVI